MSDIVLPAVLGLVAVVCAAIAWRTARDARRRSDARVAALAAAIDPSHAHEPAPRLDVRGTPALHPLAKVALGFGAVTAVIVVAALAMDATESRAAATSPRDAPVGLLSMQHQRQPDTLTVSGTIRNEGSEPLHGVVADVTLIGGRGASPASHRVGVVPQSLAPGAAASFTVTIAGSESVERYRVGFRNGDGVVRHVDRRASAGRP